MSDIEQQCAVKFCFRLGHNATETFAKLQQACGDSVLSRAQVFWWFKAFSEGRESIEDEPRSERPSVSKTTENVVKVRDLVRSDRRLTSSYSPDLSPCDFFLFPKLNNHLKGHHFGTLENIQTAVTDQPKAIPISEFYQCYEEWKKRLQRCVASENSYFVGDNVELRLKDNNIDDLQASIENGDTSKDEVDLGDLNETDIPSDLQDLISELEDNNGMMKKTMKILPQPWKRNHWVTSIKQLQNLQIINHIQVFLVLQLGGNKEENLYGKSVIYNIVKNIQVSQEI
ncbi:protein GVQW3 [Trichonephila clavipes]|nr:protein GVQW3 [Trichonephila clavipes]